MKKKTMSILLLSSLILSSCSNKDDVKNKSENEKIDVTLFEMNDKKRSKYEGYTVEEVYLNGQKVKIDVQSHGDHYHIIYNGKKYSLSKEKYDELFNPNNKIVLEGENIEKSLSEISSSDIISYYKHGDHWHVKTKYGEFITHEDPSKIKNFSELKHNAISTISKKDLSKVSIVSYYKHGDHWHVKTSDGKEYVTYTDPSKGSHNSNKNNDNNVEVVDNISDNKINGVKIVSYYKHGDHWHVKTSDGKEYVTYTDPSKDSHDSNKNNDNNVEVVDNISDNKINGVKIVSYYKHGDHWHVKTSDGKEYITYTDPSGKSNLNDVSDKEELVVEKDTKLFEKVIKHGDHVHVWYKGKEYVISNEDYEKAIKENKFSYDENNNNHPVNPTNAVEIVFIDDSKFVIGHGDHGHEFPISSLKLSSKPKGYILNNNDIVGFNSEGYYVKAPTKLENGTEIFVIYFEKGLPKGAIENIPSFLEWKLSDNILKRIVDGKILEVKELYKDSKDIDEKLKDLESLDNGEALSKLNSLIKQANYSNYERLIPIFDYSGDDLRDKILSHIDMVKKKISENQNLKGYMKKVEDLELGISFAGADKNSVKELNSIIEEINQFYHSNKEEIEKNNAENNNSNDTENNDSDLMKKVKNMLNEMDKKNQDGENENSVIFGGFGSSRYSSLYYKVSNLKKLIETNEIKDFEDIRIKDVVKEFEDNVNKYGPLQEKLKTLKEKIRSSEGKIEFKDYYNLLSEYNSIYADSIGDKMSSEFDNINQKLSDLENKFKNVESKEDNSSDNNKPVTPPDDDPWNTRGDESDKDKDKPVTSPDDDPWNTRGDESDKDKDKPVTSPDDDPWNTRGDESDKDKDKPVTPPNDDPWNTRGDESDKDKDKPVTSPDDDPWNTGFTSN